MGRCCTLLSVVFVALAGIVIWKIRAGLLEVPPLPKLEDTWWGPGDPTKEDTSIKPFKINVPDEDLKDLQNRLTNVRPMVPSLEGSQQRYGINSKHLQNILTFWRTKYNWREREHFLNQYPQYTVSVQGLKIHYLHVKPAKTTGLTVLPMLLLHGWPGSVREFYEIIPKLTTAEKGKNFAFELIIPSLPGYGFSQGAVRPGLGAAQMAVVFKNLMKRLGYEKYYIQGGDWGGIIVQHMAVLFPDNIVGVHSNMCGTNTPLSNLKLILGNFYPPLVVEKENEHKIYPLSQTFSYLMLESGYMHLQATKPDTVGVALKDSPAGLAAYILEKFTTWTNPEWKNLEDGGLTKKFTLTDLLDNVMIYWITGSITTSVRLYAETFNSAQYSLGLDRIPVEVPSGCAQFRYELLYTPRSILELKYTNLVQSTDYNDGGHFAAFEMPNELAKDIIGFVDKVHNKKAEK